ncbi:MAG: hypothetical protein RL106_1738 [Bacteroidota bacterium]|jgi:hypothetical protein
MRYGFLNPFSQKIKTAEMLFAWRKDNVDSKEWLEQIRPNFVIRL